MRNEKYTILQIVFLSIIILQTFIIVSLPLIQLMNDSGWYFMNVNLVDKGIYINESRYPSFSTSSQYYPFFGYSCFLFFCSKIAIFLHIDLPFLIKIAQFVLYILSGIMVQKIIFSVIRKENTSYLLGIIFLLYYPYFNYVNLVMSETYAIFLVLLTIYCFTQTKSDNTRIFVPFLYLLAGYIILVKPVFLPISIMVVFMLTLNLYRSQKRLLIPYIVLIMAFPISQMLFSMHYYNNYKIQSGYGWHIWNRVIFSDNLIPKNSKHLDNLKKIYNSYNKNLSFGYWWDVTKDLSDFGYTETETQKICEDIAHDGIKEYPFEYLLNTFRNSYINFLQLNTYSKVYKSNEDYFKEIELFSKEQQHKPLTNILLNQSYYTKFPFNNTILAFNRHYAEIMNYFNYLFHNIIVLLMYLLVGVHSIYVFFDSKLKQGQTNFLIWFSAFSIIFGSNLLEYPQTRLFQLAVIFIVMIIGIKISALFYRNNDK